MDDETRDIGPIAKGAFHRWLGKKEDAPITAEDIAKGLASPDEHVKKMAQFAKNAKSFNAEETDKEKRGEEPYTSCSTCNGSGDCQDCGGSGEVPGLAPSVGGQQQNGWDEVQRLANPDLERRKAVAERIDGIMERRDFAASDVEIRSLTDGKLRFTGYASTTETPYTVVDFEETISRGAFKRTLADSPDTVLLVNHDGLPLARTKSGTLTLTEDARGLRVDADLDPNDPDVARLRPKIERGDLSEMSFAFRAVQQDWNDDYTQRTIREVSIHRGDVSVVTHGANSDTAGSISLRDAVETFEQRSGRVFSKQRKDRLQAIKDELDAMLNEAEPPPDPEPEIQDVVNVTLLGARAHTDLIKARRAKARTK